MQKGELPPHRSLRLLVVDDDRDYAAEIAELLACSDCATRTAHTAGEARKACADWQPDVVIMDCVLGAENGLELALELAGLQPAPKLTVMASGRELSDSEEASLGNLDHAFLLKPMNIEALLGLLRPLRDSLSPG